VPPRMSARCLPGTSRDCRLPTAGDLQALAIAGQGRPGPGLPASSVAGVSSAGTGTMATTSSVRLATMVPGGVPGEHDLDPGR